MKVLWITNILFPEVASKIIGSDELKSSGGWMLGAADALLEISQIELYVAAVSPLVSELTVIEGEKIKYYVIPLGKGNLKENPEYKSYCKRINTEIAPDVVHIHGTEYSHGHAYIKACGIDNVVISIQGLKSAYYYYYYYGITKSEIYKNITIRDILRGTLIHDQRSFKLSSSYEVEMIRMAKHIIGRTSWDRARVWEINQDAEYHFCNESLRKEFYDGSLWNYNRCNRHSIFLSQAGYPIKGLHQLLKAMPLILRDYPDATIRIAGSDITKSSSFKEFMRLSGYGRYIKKQIRRFGLEGNVVFTGNLNAEEMKHEYLNCNVFVCPSSIENSPNSLGEAQILGVPCIASYVGGIPDMMKGNEDNMYRFEEVDMLSEKICRVFKDEASQVSMTAQALERHDRMTNALRLLDIYNAV